MSRRSFVSGAIILMLSGFIVRILGFVYRIYLSNLIGAEGMGLFQLISPVYSLIILTLTSGISIAVSKLVAAEMAKSHLINLRRITFCALIMVLSSGMVVSVFIYFNLNFIVNVIWKDSRTYWSMMLLIPSIPVIAAASALKGYFYGIQEVIPTALSQIVEQLVRISLVMVMAGYFLNVGLEYACALATAGMAIGEISNLLVLCIVYRFRKHSKKQNLSKSGLMRKRIILKELITISIPVSFNRFVNSIMFSIETILIPRALLEGGLNYTQSMEELGRLSGMAMPLLYFPSMVTSSLATTLVPAISEAISLKQYKSVNYRISKSIQVTFIIGFIFTAIFMSFPHEIANMIYRKERIGNMLYLLSFTCVFMYLQQTLLGTLNGLGKQGISLRNTVIGYCIRIGFVQLCIPIYGITGYVWGIIASSALVCILNLYTVIKTTGMTVDLRNWIIKPGLVCMLMIFTGKYVYSFFMIFVTEKTWTMVLTLIGSIAIGLSLMFAVGVLQKDEIIRLVHSKKQ